MKKRQKIKYGGNLSSHWRWNLIMAFSLLILSGCMFFFGMKAGVMTLAFSVVYIVSALILYMRNRSRILGDLVNFATQYGTAQEEILQEFVLPASLLEPDGKVLWMNDEMYRLTGKKQGFRRNIATIFPTLTPGEFPLTDQDRDIDLTYQEREYRVHIRRMVMNSLLDEVEIVNRREGEDQYIYMAYFFDETDLKRYMTENREQKPVVAMVYIDNFEEALERVDEVQQSLMTVLVDRRITKYFTAMNALVRKLEKDRYLAIFNQKTLDALKEDKFSILEDVKNINIGNDQNFTISIGVGISDGGYLLNYEYARSAMEMALGRSGDQAVIKDHETMSFYGGKSQKDERNTRVKARVKAQALREILVGAEKVVVMGHKRTDMDSLGACIGIYRAACTLGKETHVVVGEANEGIRFWVDQFRSRREYGPDMILDREQAAAVTDANTAVVVVDTNRRSMVDCEEALEKTSTVILLDHHRQTTDTIQDASLSYIETSASSACEMIAEILQYFGEGDEEIRLKNLEADCIYAGIVIDTNNFMAKTGARTFEAAAYLRRSGLDVIRVRKALRENLDSYKARAEAVRGAENYLGRYAIGICPANGVESPNVVGAQAANELLNIIGVKASFVVTEYQDQIFISARSIDEVNVQIIMEKLGGGGHSNIAGAQLKGISAQEAVTQIKQVLKQMTDDQEI